MKYYNLNKDQKEIIRGMIFDNNLNIAASGLLGFAVKKLAPSKENFERFQKQFLGHPLCGCVGCVEIGKQFAIATPEIKEEIIGESTKEIEAGSF